MIKNSIFFYLVVLSIFLPNLLFAENYNFIFHDDSQYGIVFKEPLNFNIEDFYRNNSKHDKSVKYGEDDRLVKIVYCVACDREPYPDYDKRLDYVLKKIQTFYSSEMEKSGYLDNSGHGKTFKLETNLDGSVKVNLIDHSPDGNFPDSSKTVASYRENLGAATGDDIYKHLPTDFGKHAALVIIAETIEVKCDNNVYYGSQGGMGESGPGKGGIVYFTDHIFGIRSTTGCQYTPLAFDMVGRNDSEQLAIFKDIRFSNLIATSYPYNRFAPPVSWQQDELPDWRNMMVWECASMSIGAFAHELGHAFALPHCFRVTPTVDEGVFHDNDIMGNGFRRFFKALFPNETFLESENYSRYDYDISAFPTGSSLFPVNAASLNVNQFFNYGVVLKDYDLPKISFNSVEYNPTSTTLSLDIITQETTGTTASGLNNIRYLLDWAAHTLVKIPDSEKFNEIHDQTTLTFHPFEKEIIGWILWKGLHSIVATSMDNEGNGSPLVDSIYYFSIDEYRINDWLIWSEYFDCISIVGNVEFDEQLLRYQYLPISDTQIIPRKNRSMNGRSWRQFHTGDYVCPTDKKHVFFNPIPAFTYKYLCYAGANLISNRDRNLKLCIGYDDFVQIFLNKNQIYMDEIFTVGHNAFDANQYVKIDVNIRKGENHLLIKNLNIHWSGGFHVWFEEQDGTAVELRKYPPSNPDVLSIYNDGYSINVGIKTY